jgi:hypothetical protein
MPDLNLPDLKELRLMLPFYVNGTLDAENCARIDQGLARSLELRNELAELNGFAQRVNDGGQAMMKDIENGDPQTSMADYTQKIAHADPVQKRNVDRNAPIIPAGLLGFLNPKNWHPAVSLALVAAAVAQAGMLVDMTGDRQASGQQIATLEKRVGDLEYQLASGPGGGTPTADILVQVKDDVPWQALSDLLATEGLSIIDGPSDNTLSLSSDLNGPALDAVIARLRASGLIDSADKAA